MDTNITQYIASQPAERQDVLAQFHAIILAQDPSVQAQVSGMMGKEMIVYDSRGMMKYALASMKSAITFHILPMYGSKPILEKYSALLPQAGFQKGCINFKTPEAFPLPVLTQLIQDCAPIDLVAIREAYLESKKKAKKAKPAA